MKQKSTIIMDLLIKRGSKKAVDLYVGKKGELFLDQDNDSLRMSDESTPGGLEILNKDAGGNYNISSKRLTWIYQSTNDSYVDISGGSESSFAKAAGASLLMSGADYTGTAIPTGTFYLSSTNGKEMHSLNGTAAGDLFWKGNPVLVHENYNDVANGVMCMKFSNKMMFCWGTDSRQINHLSYTFPIPFVKVPILLFSPWGNNNTDDINMIKISSLTNTGFVTNDIAYGCTNKTIHWMAFGHYV